MGRTLVLEASPRGEESYSIRVANAFIHAYCKQHSDEEILRINLFEKELPTFDAAAAEGKVAILYGKEGSDRAKNRWHQIEDVIAEFKSADRYVLAVPMWNFSIPYVLKHYIDTVTQPTHTFVRNESGYEGLLHSRKALAVYASGGIYAEGHPMDFQKPYVRHFLRFVGITDITEIEVGPMMGPHEIREEAVQKSIQKAETLALGF